MKSTTILVTTLAVATCALSPPPPVLAGSLAATAHAKSSGDFGLEAAPGSSCASPETVVLDSQIVITDVNACSFITATDTAVSGNLDFAAGIRVALGDGFQVQTGASFSIETDITLTRLAFVTDSSPAGETNYKAGFRLRLDDVSIPATGTSLIVHLAGFSADGTRHFEIRLKRNAIPAENRLVLAAREDNGSIVVLPFGEEVALPAGYNLIGVDWRAGGGTGQFLISLNGVPFGGLTGLDNFLARIDRVEWGITDGDVAAITGHLDMDDFSSTD